MFFVPIYIEALRSRPRLVFWIAALSQALIWIAVPVLFYAAPPPNLAQLLAIGHELRFNSAVGPPLAYWLGEVAFRIGGLPGVYVLAQLCVLATYWCVFALARAIVGPVHAVLAVLVMVGISLFTVPSPDFGPPILAMALWAAVLLSYWQAVVEGDKRAWPVLGAAAALLLLTSDAALVFLGTLGVFTAATRRGRLAFDATEPWAVAVVLAFVLFAHLLWLNLGSDGIGAVLAHLHSAQSAASNMSAWLKFLGALALAHAGLVVLVVLAGGWPHISASPAPPIVREPVDSFALTFVKVFALVPALLATVLGVLFGRVTPIGGLPPLVVISGLAVIVAAGDVIMLYHQRILGFAWAGLLLGPATFVPLVLLTLPWVLGVDFKVAQPARAMAHFFADSFERRTGHPLAVVAGDPVTAALVAVDAPSRPRVFFGADPARLSWMSADELRQKGAIVVWPASEASPGPPPAIKATFPDLVAEVPETFSRPVQGRLPVLRVGWGLIRPGSVAAP